MGNTNYMFRSEFKGAGSVQGSTRATSETIIHGKTKREREAKGKTNVLASGMAGWQAGQPYYHEQP